MRQRLLILGSTGSIGTQALDVVRHVNALHDAGKSAVAFDVVGLAAGRNGALLAEQARRFGVRDVACVGAEGNGAANGATNGTTGDCGADVMAMRRDGLRVREGAAAAETLVREVECDVVLAAIVGIAGLASTLAAVELGRTVALANKETLVAGGELVTRACAKTGSRLLPVDSEHAALFQALLAATREPGLAPPIDATRIGAAGCGLDRVTLTASGGPFRTWDAGAIAAATPAEALKHPTWRMGAKVTIDSASLMNKGLEVIEAHWLFGLSAERIGVLVHPQSIVHAMVHMRDGSLVMACAKPDMRTPIQQALTWPTCLEGAGTALGADALARLEFSPPDLERFPCLGLAYRALAVGGGAGAVLNAANEEAVGAFLRGGAGAPRFGEIAELVAAALDRAGDARASSMSEIAAADRLGREVVCEALRARR